MESEVMKEIKDEPAGNENGLQAEISVEPSSFRCNVCVQRCRGNRTETFYDQIVQDFFANKIKQENGSGPEEKKTKTSVCAMCLGILQSHTWEPILDRIEREIEDRKYDSSAFACALSFPNSILLREKAIGIYYGKTQSLWKTDNLVPLKEAWKWSFGPAMAKRLGKSLESGASCPFLINVHMAYENDTEELNTLKKMVPKIFAEREKAHKKFRGEAFTKKSVEDILNNLSDDVFKLHFPCPPKDPPSHSVCENVTCSHGSIFLAGRYIKKSKELCQTPWVLDGKKVMETSIQDIIFEPIVKLYKIPPETVKDRLKFMSAGREDVDVRCLGDGRPFAIEIVNPTLTNLSEDLLNALQKSMSERPELISVRHLQVVPREGLSVLKKGEEFESKQYIALCVKLKPKEGEHVELEKMTIRQIGCCDKLVPLTDEDISLLRDKGKTGFTIKQATPIRVLHRRPMLIRERKIISMDVKTIEGMPNLFYLKVQTEAGTYVKELVHGDFGRTKPNISTILQCNVDILCLDVTAVNLNWPPKTLSR